MQVSELGFQSYGFSKLVVLQPQSKVGNVGLGVWGGPLVQIGHATYYLKSNDTRFL